MKNLFAAICLLGPSLLLVWLREQIVKEHDSIYANIVHYAFSVVFLNWFMMLLWSYAFNNKGDLFLQLNQQSRFACKYITLSLLLAFVEPYIERFIRDKVIVDMRMPVITFRFSHWRTAAVIYGSILFALNFIRIFDNNFWGDAAFTANLVVNTVPDIIKITAADVHPPLYYLFVKAGYVLFGNQGWIFHFVSLIPLGIIIIFTLTSIWENMGKETAFILLTFIGLSPNAVKFNIEVRMYSWAALFILLTFYYLYRILSEEKWRYYVFFCLFSLAAAYTHYYCLLAVSFFYVFLFFVALYKKRLSIKKVLTISICILVMYFPWLIILLEAMLKRVGNYWIKNIPTLKSSLGYLFALHFDKAILLWLLLGLILLREMRIYELERTENGKYRVLFFSNKAIESDILLWKLTGLVSIFGTIGCALFISKNLQPFYTLRYIYPLSVVLWLILGQSLARIKWKGIITSLLVIAILFVSVPAYVATYTNAKNANVKLQITLHATKEAMNKDDIILTNHYHINWTIARYYYPGKKSQLVELNKLPELKSNTSYWLIVSGKQKMDKAFRQIQEQGFSWKLIVEDGNLGTHRVWIYKLTYKDKRE